MIESSHRQKAFLFPTRGALTRLWRLSARALPAKTLKFLSYREGKQSTISTTSCEQCRVGHQALLESHTAWWSRILRASKEDTTESCVSGVNKVWDTILEDSPLQLVRAPLQKSFWGAQRQRQLCCQKLSCTKRIANIVLASAGKWKIGVCAADFTKASVGCLWIRIISIFQISWDFDWGALSHALSRT